MKRQNLILLTKQFPFLQKEQYVAHELKYLAQEFEQVFIYPHDYFGKDENMSFDLPANVKVIHLNKSILPAQKLEVMMSFLGAFFYELMHTHNREWLTRDIKRLVPIYAAQYALGAGLIRWLKENNVDLNRSVFYSYWFSNSALCLAILKKRNLIRDFVSRAHSLDLYHEDWGLLNEVILIPPFRHFKQRYVHTIFSINDHGQLYLKNKFPKLLVKTAYLGVDDFGLNPNSLQDASKPVVVTCSGFDENKRLHLLGESLSRINKPVRWIHFGDGVMRSEAEASITSSAVEFVVMGQTTNAAIRKFYQENHVDLFVNVSLVEGLPVTIMEALSHGIPALATAVNGTPEAVKDGVTGKLIAPAFTAEEIDAAIEEMLSDAWKNPAKREACRRIFETQFEAEVNYRAFARHLSAEN
jgi:colanic acid/amylovoran biosynthesis glycosyltransferase